VTRHPGFWSALLLILAAFRTARLIGWDDITAPLRARLLITDADYWEWQEVADLMRHQGLDPHDGYQRRMAVKQENHRRNALAVDNEETIELLHVPDDPGRVRAYIAQLIHCPWCSGFWLALLWWAGWLSAAGVTLWIATPLALSAAVGLIGKHLDA
jgi:hypothetical protein